MYLIKFGNSYTVRTEWKKQFKIKVNGQIVEEAEANCLDSVSCKHESMEEEMREKCCK